MISLTIFLRQFEITFVHNYTTYVILLGSIWTTKEKFILYTNDSCLRPLRIRKLETLRVFKRLLKRIDI